MAHDKRTWYCEVCKRSYKWRSRRVHLQSNKHKQAELREETTMGEIVACPDATALTDFTPLYRTKNHRRALECFRVAAYKVLDNARLTDILKPQDLELAAAFMIAVQRKPWWSAPDSRTRSDETILHHLRGTAMEGVLQTVPLAYNHGIPVARRKATRRGSEPHVENKADLDRFWMGRLRSSPELDRLLWFMATTYNRRHAAHAMKDSRLVRRMHMPSARFVYIANNGRNGRQKFFAEPPPAEDGESESQRDSAQPRQSQRGGPVHRRDRTESGSRAQSVPVYDRGGPSRATLGGTRALPAVERWTGRVWQGGRGGLPRVRRHPLLYVRDYRPCVRRRAGAGIYARLVWDEHKGEFRPGDSGDILDALLPTSDTVKTFMESRGHPCAGSTGAKALLT